jgi:hypothetical protein
MPERDRAGDDPKLRSEALKQNRHQVRDENDAEKRVPELRSASQIGGPVPRIHVADGYQIAGASEGEHFPPPGPSGERNGTVNLSQ